MTIVNLSMSGCCEASLFEACEDSSSIEVLKSIFCITPYLSRFDIFWKLVCFSPVFLLKKNNFFKKLSKNEKNSNLIAGLLICAGGLVMVESAYAENGQGSASCTDPVMSQMSQEQLNLAFFWALENGDVESVTIAIICGVDVNKADRYGATPLHYAANRGHIEIVNALIAAGADVNQANKHGEAPLHQAAKRGPVEIVNALIEAGAAVNQANNYGSTPLHYAVFRGPVEIVNALIEAGAAVSQANNSGKTPLSMIARNYDRFELVDFLQVLGAKEAAKEAAKRYREMLLTLPRYGLMLSMLPSFMLWLAHARLALKTNVLP
jgi:hypothetical protein